MTIEIEKYARKSFEVHAVLVTQENILEVTHWCGGELAKDRSKSGEQYYVSVLVGAHKGPKKDKTSMYVGDWITVSNGYFKVYKEQQFKAIFKPVPDNKFEAVLKLVREAMSKQDVATYHGDQQEVKGLDEEITHQIFELL